MSLPTESVPTIRPSGRGRLRGAKRLRGADGMRAAERVSGGGRVSGAVRAIADRCGWGAAGRRGSAEHLPVDALFALGMFLFFTALQHGVVRHAPAPTLLVQSGLVVPLAWRRRAPMVVFGAVAAVAFAQWLAGVKTPADGVLLVALYTVAAQVSGLARLLAAFTVLESGIVLATVRWSMHDRAVAGFVSLSAMAVAAAVIGTNMRSRREHMEFLEDRAVRLERERDQRAQLAVAGERARIAREMHDIVTHNLSVMVALADGAAFAIERSPDRAAAAMRQTSSTGRQAMTDMRRFLGVLRADEPDALRRPMPGIAQLDALAEQVRAAGLPTRLEVTGEPAVVPAAAQLTAFRLVQEALTNTLKHAPAGARAEVRLSCEPDALAVSVMDDGAGATPPAPPPGPSDPREPYGPSTPYAPYGPDRPGRSPQPASPSAPARAAGHGLAGMRERAAAYGGQLTAGPRPGGGWQVATVLALATPEAL